MDTNRFSGLNLEKLNWVDTPYFLVHEGLLENNLKILQDVQKRADCKILLALKAFSMFSTFPLISKYLNGVCASGLYEAKLGREDFKKEVHVFSPAFSRKDFDEVLKYADHIVFNSFSQLEQFKPEIEKVRKQGRKIKYGIRVNPEKSVASEKFGIYDPSSKNSRLGVTLKNFEGHNLEGLTGLHFHALCEQGADELEKVLNAFDEKFGKYFGKMKWVNFGGGHHITRQGYDRDKLVKLIQDFRKKYPNIKDVYLEPGEAVVLDSGFFVASVLDFVRNDREIAIIDSSVETHFPDVLITRHENSPYVPEIVGAGNAGEYPYNYTIAGNSCAAGDVLGEYSFSKPLKKGDKLMFTDAAHYSMVKTNTFNGIALPKILVYNPESDKVELVREFGYEDFKNRLS